MIVHTQKLHRTYDDIADDYADSIAILNTFYSRFYLRHMPRRRDSVLDIGCGTGDILAKLSKHFTRSFGIDPIEKFVRKAKTRAPGAAIQTASAEALPFENESMDYVISHIVFQHVDRKLALQEAVRVLKPGGRLIISEVLTKDDSRRTPAFDFYRGLLATCYLLAHYGLKRTRLAKTYEASANWKQLTAIHRARRFSFTELRGFYAKKLPGAAFTWLDAKTVALRWDKPEAALARDGRTASD